MYRVNLTLQVTVQAAVMAEGQVLTEGTVAEVKSDERVIEAYLGTGLKNKVEA